MPLWKHNQPATAPIEIRDTLFGDMPLDAWPSVDAPLLDAEPWASFIAARDAQAQDNIADAIHRWRQITAMPDLEPRHYLQAWHFLRQYQVQPPDEESAVVHGMVIEVSMGVQGLDLLAAYSDGTARYYNYSGSGIVWERPSELLDAEIDAFLDAGRKAAHYVGVWEGPRPPAPPPDQVRVSMLTPGGLRFGQGTFQALNAEELGRMLIGAGTALMQALSRQVPTT
jgi:hypothetical protein